MGQLSKLFRERILGVALDILEWIALAILFAFAFSSCSIYSVDPLAAYIVEEGEHYSHYYTYFNKSKETKGKVAPIIIRGNRIDFSHQFNEMHKYDFTITDGGDINKLYGITSTKIHENSARIGWRYVGEDNFEVFAYYYVRGKRDWHLMDTVQTKQVVYYSIDVSGNQYTFGVNDKWYHVPLTKNILAARAFPYFGGNNTAPHKMIFKIVEL